MKKALSVLLVAMFVASAFAEGEIDKTAIVTTASYVDSAFNALDSAKQNIIDDSHKLDADLISDSTSTNKFVTASDKTTWNGKQGQLVNDAVTPANIVTTVKTSVTATPASASDTNLVTEKAVSTAIETAGTVTNSGNGAIQSVTGSGSGITVTRGDAQIVVKSGGNYSSTATMWIE